MVQMFIFWKSLTLLGASNITLKETSNSISIPTVFEALALLFLAVGIIAFFLMRRSQSMNARTGVVSGQMNMWQVRVASVALPTFLAVPVIVLLVIWLGASTLPPLHSVNPSPTVYVSVIVKPPTNLLSVAIAHDLVAPHVLTIGTDTKFPPQTYLDSNGNPIGFDIDVISAIANKMGLKPVFVQMGYGSLSSNLDNHQLDVVISAYSINDVKNKENFVRYLNPADVLLIPEKNPGIAQFTKFTDLCGHSISVLQNSSEDAVLHHHQNDCTNNKSAPLSPINIIEKQDIKSVINAVVNTTSNGADAAYLDDPTANFYQNNDFKGEVQIMGSMPGASEVIVIQPGDTTTNLVIQNAFNQIVLDQTYSKLLAKWNLTQDQLPGTD